MNSEFRRIFGLWSAWLVRKLIWIVFSRSVENVHFWKHTSKERFVECFVVEAKQMLVDSKMSSCFHPILWFNVRAFCSFMINGKSIISESQILEKNYYRYHIKKKMWSNLIRIQNHQPPKTKKSNHYFNTNIPTIEQKAKENFHWMDKIICFLNSLVFSFSSNTRLFSELSYLSVRLVLKN
jgi:hypothetical protein